MYTVLYLCRYRPVWYEAGDFPSFAAAVAEATRLLASGRPAVQVQNLAGQVVYSLS